MKKYILEGHTPVVVEDLHEWATWYGQAKCRQVARTKVGRVMVSTVFLGLDHNFWRGGPPILFETMIFGGRHDQKQWRYATWDEAEYGHRRVVKMLREKRTRLHDHSQNH